MPDLLDRAVTYIDEARQRLPRAMVSKVAAIIDSTRWQVFLNRVDAVTMLYENHRNCKTPLGDPVYVELFQRLDSLVDDFCAQSHRDKSAVLAELPVYTQMSLARFKRFDYVPYLLIVTALTGWLLEWHVFRTSHGWTMWWHGVITAAIWLCGTVVLIRLLGTRRRFTHAK